LTRIAAARGKSKLALVCEALTEFVAYEEADIPELALSEEAFAAAVEEGLAALEAGGTVSDDRVMREIEELLARKR
jgi:predicted transcriptional regulator